MTETNKTSFEFGHLNFGFVSSFDIRISNLIIGVADTIWKRIKDINSIS